MEEDIPTRDNYCNKWEPKEGQAQTRVQIVRRTGRMGGELAV